MAGKGAAIRAVITGGAGKVAPTRGEAEVSTEAEDVAGPEEDHAADEVFADELKPGTKLFHGQYTIIDFLNSGGFGITYLARDSLDRMVVIKECFPGTLCRRSNQIVRARSRAHQSDFRSVVRLFVQEARNLSKLVHPNIVGVHQVFEDNDTAYMAIDYIRGRDLLDLLEDKAHIFTPERVVRYLGKMLEAVRFVHDTGMLHRDISPDNILIDEKDEPILIDFGAAREQATKQSRALSTLRVVKDGYSPQEFYIAGSVQNESSDLYALAATFYHVISGAPPPDSQKRLSGIAEGDADPYVPLAGRFPGYPPGFLEALDKAASILPKDRLKSAEEWMRMIADAARTAEAARESARVAEIESAVARLVLTPAADDTPARPASPPAVTAPAPGTAATTASAVTAAAPSRRRLVPALSIGTAAALLAVAGYALLGRAPETAAPMPLTEIAPPGAAPAAVPPAELAPGGDRRASLPAPLPAVSVRAEGPAIFAAAIRADAGASAEVPQRPPVVARLSAGAVIAGVAAGASAEGAAAARRLAVAATGLTYEPAPVAAATGPARDPAVRPDQVARVTAVPLLPFETRSVRIGDDFFPEISALLPSSAVLADARDWLRPGVTIYSVNNNWVSDHESIMEQLALAGAGDGPVELSLRIREDLDSPFRAVALTVPEAREVVLHGGLAVRTEPSAEGWRTTVADPGHAAELAAGDVVLSEATTGRVVDGPMAFEEIVSALAAGTFAEGRFTVLRSGAEIEVAVPLATGG